MEQPTNVADLEDRVDLGVMSFVVDMKYKLRLNNHKGHWCEYDGPTLVEKLKGEVKELEFAMAVFRKGPATSKQLLNAIQECADVANYAMMIADNCKRLMRTIDGAKA